MAKTQKAQEYINEKYPTNEVCKSKSDEENKDKKREQITILDLSKGKVGKSRFSDGKILTGSLKLEGFTNLHTLIISSQQITSLDVSDCSSLREVELINCPKELTENKEAIKLHIESNLIFNLKKTKLVKELLITSAQEDDVRNILIVGWTGDGKSTLANTLINKNEDFEEVFLEGKYGTSKTKGYQKNDEPFEWKGKRYCLIDNIGFGDTSNKLSEEDIVERIVNGIESSKEGINQILFVVRGRFTEKHTKAFNSFESFISDSGITKFTTIVRTGFVNFRSQSACNTDRRVLTNGNEEVEKIVSSCNDVIYVDNPSITAGNEEEIGSNKKKREESRKIVLNYLAEKCPDIYKVEEWDDIYTKIDKYKKVKEKLASAEDGREKLETEKNNLFKELKLKLGLENVPGLPIGFEAQIEVKK